MSGLQLAGFALLCAAISAGAIAALRRSRWVRHLVDRPNERSLHVIPVPRLGGLGVLAGALPASYFLQDAALAVAWACAGLLLALSLVDDVRALPIEVRLPAHLVAALCVLLVVRLPAAGLPPGAQAPLFVATLLALVWMTNLFNFMDGADGLAGGMAAIGFGAYAIAAFEAGAIPLAAASVALSGAALGFLAHNFPPARVFLGDCGSIPLGFLAGALGLIGASQAAWPAWFPLAVFAPFILDATLTLARRALRGEAFWRAHRTHLYQRLVLAGWSHRRLATSAAAVEIAGAALALNALSQGESMRCGIIAVWIAFLALLVLVAGRHATPPPARSARQPARR